MEVPAILTPYACHGVEFIERAGANEFVGVCPFCDKSGHFYANKLTGQYSCKKCTETGNVQTFLKHVWKQAWDDTGKTQYRRLARSRGLPVRALKRFWIANNGDGVWLVPCFSERQTIMDIRRWKEGGRRLMSTTGCKTQLFGLQRLKEYKRGQVHAMWLCEGEWDVIAMSEMMRRAGYKGDAVLGVPGADCFKKEWLKHFEGKHVNICYDSDEAGDRGSAKAAKLLRGVAKSINFLNWPEDLANGYDVRDYFLAAVESELDPKQSWNDLCTLLKPTHRRQDSMDTGGVEDGDATESHILADGARSFRVVSSHERPSIRDVLAKMREHYQMDSEMCLATRYVLAVCMSQQLPDDPLWGYLVAAPSGGKTLITNTLKTSDRAMMRSNMTPQSLISGWQGGGKDPSLLSKVDGMILVAKDFTESLELPEPVRDSMMSMLRGAFDGEVRRNFGNQVTRFYQLRFTLLANVTPVIHAYSKATMGDRLVKLQMRRTGGLDADRARVTAAIHNVTAAADYESEIADTVADFLAVTVGGDGGSAVPRLPEWVIRRLENLCVLVGRLRTVVERDRDARLLYKPEAEYGTRLAKQLAKLAVAVTLVDGVKTIGWRQYQMVERVALDTGAPFHTDVIRMLIAKRGEATRDEIAAASILHRYTCARILEDLELLGMVQVVGKKRMKRLGRPSDAVMVSEEIRELWTKARIGVRPKFGRK